MTGAEDDDGLNIAAGQRFVGDGRGGSRIRVAGMRANQALEARNLMRGRALQQIVNGF